MATDESPDSGNRVTTALVYRAVDDLGRRVDAHFDGVKQRLDRLEPVETRVDGHDAILANHEARLIQQERAESERSKWWKVTVPPLIVASLALVIAVVMPIVT